MDRGFLIFVVPTFGHSLYNASLYDMQKSHADYFPQIKNGTVGFTASCEQSLFLKEGIDTVVVGPGSIAQAHQVDEFVEIEELKQAVGFYAYCIINLLT